MPCHPRTWFQGSIGGYARSCERRASVHIGHWIFIREGGRGAGTREPEDLPAIASLFRWTGRSTGTVIRTVTRAVRKRWEIVQ